MKNKDPPEVCPPVLAVAVRDSSTFLNRSMKITKGRKITFADVNAVLGNVVKLASLIYALYKIVAHR